MTRIDQIVGDIYRISTWNPRAGITFNQFLLAGERPPLIHTGLYGDYDSVRNAVAEVLDPSHLAHVILLHFEADECGGMDRFAHEPGEPLSLPADLSPLAIGVDALLRPGAFVAERSATCALSGRNSQAGTEP